MANLLENTTVEELSLIIKDSCFFTTIKAYTDEVCTYPKDREYIVRRVVGGEIEVRLKEGDDVQVVDNVFTSQACAVTILRHHKSFIKSLKNV